VFLQFNRCNVSSLFEFGFQLVLSDALWDESYEDIRFIVLLLALDNKVVTSALWDKIILFSIDVRHNEDSVTIQLFLHVHSLDSGVGARVIFEVNVS